MLRPSKRDRRERFVICRKAARRGPGWIASSEPFRSEVQAVSRRMAPEMHLPRPPPPGHTAARAHDMRIHPQPPPSTHPPPPVSGSASITLPRPPNTAAAQLFVPAAVAAIANASAVAVDRTSARLFCAIEQSFPDDDGNSLENFQGRCDDRAVILGAVGFSAKRETQ